MLKFPTLLEFLDKKIGLIFNFSHYTHAGNKTLEMALARSLGCSHHLTSKCWTYLFYIPVLNPTNKAQFQDLVYTSKHSSHTSGLLRCTCMIQKSSVTVCWELQALQPWIGVETHYLA
jgi:hypothetical protein